MLIVLLRPAVAILPILFFALAAPDTTSYYLQANGDTVAPWPTYCSSG